MSLNGYQVMQICPLLSRRTCRLRLLPLNKLPLLDRTQGALFDSTNCNTVNLCCSAHRIIRGVRAMTGGSMSLLRCLSALPHGWTSGL